MKVFIILKKNIISIVLVIFIACLILFSKYTLSAAKEGLALWVTCVIPSLFPFFIATELLNYTNIINIFGKLLNPIMRPLFNLPGESAYALIMGIISGCPIGAKIVSDLYAENKCTKNEAERMLALTNNSGPLFIIGTIGNFMFKNSSIGILLFITHILSAITVGLVYGIISKMFQHKINKSQVHNNAFVDTSISNLGEILTISVSKSITSILQIGGFIVLFSVILSILHRLNIINGFCSLLLFFNISTDFSRGFFCGIIELTNGINYISNIHTKILSNNILLISFLLGFGGFSILLQVNSIVSKHKLSIKKYLYGKILQGLFAVFYTLLLINKFPIFNFDLPLNIIFYINNII